MTIKVHFDMYHGFGNLDKAIELLDINDREDLETMLIQRAHLTHSICFSVNHTIYSTIIIVFYLNGLKNVKKSLDLMKQRIMVK